MPGALSDLYVRPMVGGPGACYHRKILKSKILNALSSILGDGILFVKYVEDMIFS